MIWTNPGCTKGCPGISSSEIQAVQALAC